MSKPISLTLSGANVVALKKGTGGKLVGVYGFTTAIGFIQLFDAAQASDITLGTTPPTLSFGVGANQPLFLGPNDIGWDFTLGIFAAGTTTRANNAAATIDCNFAIDIP